jgi:hypothetical protein
MAAFVVLPNDSLVESILSTTQYLYPGLLLLILLLFGAGYSIYKARNQGDVIVPTVTGPGGRPLPVTKKRRVDNASQEPEGRFSPAVRALFQWLYTAVTLTFVGQGAAIATRALIQKSLDGEHTWWCGEPKAVIVFVPDASSEPSIDISIGLHIGLGVSVHICVHCAL